MGGVACLVTCMLMLAGPMPSTAQAVEDVSSIDAIVDAVYDEISGGIGEPRDWERIRALYHPSALVTHTSGLLEDRAPVIAPGTLQDWIDGVQYAERRGFREVEIARRVEAYGTIAHVFSTYAYSSDDGTMEGRGINSFQLLFDGDRYWILSVAWSAETDASPLPDRYLTPGTGG